jgi:hypothetical protein
MIGRVGVRAADGSVREVKPTIDMLDENAMVEFCDTGEIGIVSAGSLVYETSMADVLTILGRVMSWLNAPQVAATAAMTTMAEYQAVAASLKGYARDLLVAADRFNRQAREPTGTDPRYGRCTRTGRRERRG